MNNGPIQPPGSGSRDGARRRAQSHFEIADARTTLVKKMLDDERKATDAKTAKLRALRLAKEEEDRVNAINNPPPVAPKKTRAKAKPAGKTAAS